MQINALALPVVLSAAGLGLEGGEIATMEDLERVAAESEQAINTHQAEDDTGGCLSFTPTTPVTTEQGKQAISTLQVGEEVLAYNPKTRKMEWEPILHVWINHDSDLVDVTISTVLPAQHDKLASKLREVIHTNKKHPFFTQEKGFVPVSQITLGMHILEADGQYGVVIGWKVVPGTRMMYNLEVAQDHTFTVGMGQWVVHNSGGEDCEDSNAQSSTNDEPTPVGSLKKASDSFLKQNGVDAHGLKKETLGSNANISHYDIYIDRIGNLFLIGKGESQDTAVYTWYNLADFTNDE